MAEAFQPKTRRNKRIVELRDDTKNPLSFAEIGRIYDISRGRAHQIYNAQKKAMLKEKMYTT